MVKLGSLSPSAPSSLSGGVANVLLVVFSAVVKVVRSNITLHDRAPQEIVWRWKGSFLLFVLYYEEESCVVVSCQIHRRE